MIGFVCATQGCQGVTSGESKYCAEHRKAAHQAWLEKIRQAAEARQTRVAGWESLHAKAHRAGHAAATALVPEPMVVEGHRNQLDDSSPVVKRWIVPDGPCGFAYVTIRPGNCSFALWAKKELHAFKAYHGGMQFSVRDYGQSYDRKSAYATAYAAVLRGEGIRAHAESRLD